MNVELRPRLLITSLLTAVLVVAVATAIAVQTGGSDAPDAELTEPGQHSEPTTPRESTTGDELPDVEVFDIDGESVMTGSLTGKPLVVNVWYSTCAPCKREMPAFARVSEEYGDRVRFVGVNNLDDVSSMVEFANEAGVTYDLFLDTSYEFTDAARVVGYPTTLFVSPAGTIVDHHTGPLETSEIRSRVAQLM